MCGGGTVDLKYTVQKYLVYVLISFIGRCGCLWNDGIYFQNICIYSWKEYYLRTTTTPTKSSLSMYFFNNKNMYVSSIIMMIKKVTKSIMLDDQLHHIV